jgi:hypothetical protein
MAERAGLTDEERSALRKFDAMDQATILRARIEDKNGERDAFRAEIVALTKSGYASLSHQLLAALPVDEVVTTNFDQLFEIASRGIARAVSVLPHDPDVAARRWLLKLHGCVSRPSDIVLTREDFLRYEHHRAALAGIVQALLITKHILFVGFSLKDENFHRIADAVRRAMRGEANGADARRAANRPRFGTVLRLEADPLLETLWRDDLDFLRVDTPRRVEIFFDALLAATPPPLTHFLDPRFSGAYSNDERVLAGAFQRFLADLPADAKRGDAWTEIAKLARRLGGDPGA